MVMMIMIMIMMIMMMMTKKDDDTVLRPKSVIEDLTNDRSRESERCIS